MSKKVLIVDDEKLARDRISRLIGELKYDFILTEATSGLEALEKIQRGNPEIVLLDIQMPGLTGIEMLQQIEHRPFHVIFQTAYDEYAIQAFEENACDYLLKPYDKPRFKSAIDKAIHEINKIQKLENLEEKFRQRDGHLQKISIKRGSQLKILNLNDVLCFVSQDHYTCVYTQYTELITDLSLTHLESRLDPRKFVRCHRKNIVSITHIQSIGVGENMTVHLPNDMKLPVSRSHRQKIKNLVVL